jgi:mercuric reductase
MPHIEPEISIELTRCLRDEGIRIYTNVKVREVNERDGLKVVKCQVKELEQEFESEQLLMATGRKPNIDSLGLANAKVKTENGFIKINEYLQTSNPNIYAAGDCATPFMLETLAAKMGNKAVINAFTEVKQTINLKMVPWAVFTNPQVASVGYTDEEYTAKTNSCACSTIPMSLIPKAKIINDTRGVIKMVIDRHTHQIMGLHIVSPLAVEMIHEGTLAVKFGLTIDQIIDTVHVFPTLSESIKLVATSFYKDVSKLSCCVE